MKASFEGSHAHFGVKDGRLTPRERILVGLLISSPSMHGLTTASVAVAQLNSPSFQMNDSAGFPAETSAPKTV